MWETETEMTNPAEEDYVIGKFLTYDKFPTMGVQIQTPHPIDLKFRIKLALEILESEERSFEQHIAISHRGVFIERCPWCFHFNSLLKKYPWENKQQTESCNVCFGSGVNGDNIICESCQGTGEKK